MTLIDGSGLRAGGSPADLVAEERRRRLGPVAIDPVDAVLYRALRLGAGFKRQDEVFRARSRPEDLRDALVVDLADAGMPIERALEEFAVTVLPWCKNEASPRSSASPTPATTQPRWSGNCCRCSRSRT